MIKHAPQEVAYRAIDDITVGERYRRDVGDLGQLIESIEEIGLLHPIIVSPDNTLLAGQRRLEAFKVLGRKEIPAIVKDSLVDATDCLRVERDENTCRLPLKMSEIAELGKAIEKEKTPANVARGHANLRLGNAPGMPAGISGDSPSRTRDIVAEATGLHPRQVDRLSAVKKEVDKGNEVAIEAMEKLDDGTMTLTAAYRHVRESVGRPLDHVKKPIKPRPMSKKSIDIITSICGRCYGLESIPTKTISPEDARIWYKELYEARRQMSRLMSTLKEQAE